MPHDTLKMKLSSGHWYPVLSSRELRKRPLAKMRFGQPVVFWRNADGQPVCLEDRCAHRGSALSLGRVRDGVLECPFHGFCYDSAGRCVRVPAEGDWKIPDHFRVDAMTTCEESGYIWAWRGPNVEPDQLPAPPRQSFLDGLNYEETRGTWHSHYTRCIENVVDYSHLPFVHRRNIGRFMRDPVTKVRVEPVEGGFRFFREGDDSKGAYVEFTYPSLWAICIWGKTFIANTFVPQDDTHTEVYGRWYHSVANPLLRPFVALWSRFAQYIVFKDDLPIVASQRPANVDEAEMDKLVASDGGLVAFRKLRRAHQEEIRSYERGPGT